MVGGQIVLAALAATTVAQTLTGTNTNDDIISGADYLTGTAVSYSSYESTITLPSSTEVTVLSGMPTATESETASLQNQTITTNGSTIVTAVPTSSNTQLTASRASTNGTAAATSSAPRPTNTQPCNGYAEFCNLKYSNITQIGAHNSPFDIKGNAASNQELDVQTQLNDGIRMLQFQVHQPNDTSPLMLCHTSCDLLNAGTLVAYLTLVREWLDANPYDVVTILMGNYDVLTPQTFVPPIQESGLDRYLYTPPTVPMGLDDWPTLGEMIVMQRRVVIMLDYEANQGEIPWLLDEFANMWETPFSPTDREFPCIQDRPPGQARDVSEDRLYMANHNLNIDIEIAGFSLLVPAFPLLNETNAVEGYGSAGVMSENCTRNWDRPPNFVLVDFYNIGSYNGSVFEVAAIANGVQYNRDQCCGNDQRVYNAAPRHAGFGSFTIAVAVGVLGYLMV